jgi:kyphoscoliosis peptidase
MKKYVFILFLFSSLATFAQPANPYQKIDDFALKIGKLDSLTMGTIAVKLTKPFTDKTEKARAIYTWIANNIAYDVKAAKNGNTEKNSPAEVLIYRKAIGNGFALLFQDMCSVAGIRCLTVNGYLKKSVLNIDEKDVELNHSWAVVQLGQSPDTWHYVDVALGTGSLDETQKVFVKSFSDKYFFADKTIFNWQHFPDNEAWKLPATAAPKNIKEFLALPIIKTTAFDFTLKSFLPAQGFVKAKLKAPVAFKFMLSGSEEIKTVTIKYGDVKKPKIVDIPFTFSGGALSFTNKFNVDDDYPVIILINNKEFMVYRFLVEE